MLKYLLDTNLVIYTMKNRPGDVFNKLILLPVNIISGLKQMVFKESGRLKAIYKVFLADSSLSCIIR